MFKEKQLQCREDWQSYKESRLLFFTGGTRLEFGKGVLDGFLVGLQCNLIHFFGLTRGVATCARAVKQVHSVFNGV